MLPAKKGAARSGGDYWPGLDAGLSQRSAEVRNSIAGDLLSRLMIGPVRATRTLSRAEVY